MLYNVQESGGNSKAVQVHTAMDKAASHLKEVTQDLLKSMEEAASAGGAVTAMIDNISKAVAKVCGLPACEYTMYS